MDFEKIRKEVTKEEFINSQLTIGDGCPGMNTAVILIVVRNAGGK